MTRFYRGRHRPGAAPGSGGLSGGPAPDSGIGEPPTDGDANATIRQALSVGVATGAYGISFGALSVASGLDVWQTIALSALMFTGGSQFAFVGVLGAGGSGASAIATASLLGVRNGLYGLEIGRILGLRGWRRLLGAHLTIDESTAVCVGQPDARRRSIGFWWTGWSVFVLWNLTTAVGALLGDAIGDPRTYGLDAAAAAAFCALLWPRLQNRLTGAVALGALLVAVALSAVLPAGVPVLVAALVALVGLREPAAPASPPATTASNEDPVT